MEAFADSSVFIPNYYRNRRDANLASAIGWSDRHEAGVRLANEKKKYEINGTEFFKDDETGVNPYMFYRFENGLNTEVSLNVSETDRDFTFSGGSSDVETKSIQANLGYELKETPMAFGFGYSRIDSDTESSTGSTSESKATLLNFGVGYRLEDNVYLGASLFRIKNDNDTTDLISFGVGKVYGDKEKPDSASELIFSTYNEDGDKAYAFSYQGLCNRGPIQYYSNINLGVTDGTAKDSLGYGVKLGVDYQISDYYFGPELGVDIDDSNNDTRDTDWLASLEAGYRTSQLEFYARYNLEQQKRSFTVSKDTTSIIALGASYRF